MRNYLCLIFCLCFPVSLHTAQAQTCNNNMAASTPDSQLLDNSNGTVTDRKTGLMWKQCMEGLSGSNCENGSAVSFTWQAALQQPGVINSSGFAGYHDWRLPNVKELRSIVEEKCANPAINLVRFPNTPSSFVWSDSPYIFYNSYNAWYVHFYNGFSYNDVRSYNYQVRLVRDGQ